MQAFLDGGGRLLRHHLRGLRRRCHLCTNHSRPARRQHGYRDGGHLQSVRRGVRRHEVRTLHARVLVILACCLLCSRPHSEDICHEAEQYDARTSAVSIASDHPLLNEICLRSMANDRCRTGAGAMPCRAASRSARTLPGAGWSAHPAPPAAASPPATGSAAERQRRAMQSGNL